MTEPGKKRVLIVDDESHVRLLLKMLLKGLSCEVVGEGMNGAEALSGSSSPRLSGPTGSLSGSLLGLSDFGETGSFGGIE